MDDEQDVGVFGFLNWILNGIEPGDQQWVMLKEIVRVLREQGKLDRYVPAYFKEPEQWVGSILHGFGFYKHRTKNGYMYRLDYDKLKAIRDAWDKPKGE